MASNRPLRHFRPGRRSHGSEQIAKIKRVRPVDVRAGRVRPKARAEARREAVPARAASPAHCPALLCLPASSCALGAHVGLPSNSRTNRPMALVFLRSLLLSPPAERWPSGRRHTPAKGAGGKPSRGFESLPLRHLPSLKRSPDPAAAGFFRCFRELCGWGCEPAQVPAGPKSVSHGRYSLELTTKPVWFSELTY